MRGLIGEDEMDAYAGSDHHTRELLLENIRERPGISFSRLMRSLYLNEGTLRYHLNYLERKELIRSRKEGGKRVYFSSVPFGPETGERDGLTKDHNRVLNIIRRYPGIKPKEILSSTELSRKVLRTIIQRLKREHLIWEVENGNGAGYEVITRQRLLEEMLMDLVERFLKGEMDQSTFLHLKEWMEEEKRDN